MQRAHCHSQEYWFVRRTRCKCGTAHCKESITARRLEHRASGAVEVFALECSDCGYQSHLEFDISSFFGKVDRLSFRKLLNDEQRAWDMYIRCQLEMESVLRYLSELADSGDAPAIEFISDAVRHFLGKARTNLAR